MAKRFKLKFTIPSFRMCRSKNPSSFPGNPVPAIYRLSPVNPKAHDIGCPNLPAPPPTTPEHCGKVTSKLMSLGDGCQICCDHGHDKHVKLARGRKSTSSVPSRRSDVAIDNDEEESVSLITCTTSFSDEFCHVDETVPYSQKTERELASRHRRKISSVKKVQRLRFKTSENRREPETTEQVKKTKTRAVSGASSTTSTRSTVEGKVRESFAVVKKSKDPYQDFKRSMLEMIREMEMSEAEDLEQLLQCFLALNSRNYHEVIVRAFMEIWQQMFVLKPASTNINPQTDDVKTTDIEE